MVLPDLDLILILDFTKIDIIFIKKFAMLVIFNY
jgi:hypothetical protein